MALVSHHNVANAVEGHTVSVVGEAGCRRGADAEEGTRGGKSLVDKNQNYQTFDKTDIVNWQNNARRSSLRVLCTDFALTVCTSILKFWIISGTVGRGERRQKGTKHKKIVIKIESHIPESGLAQFIGRSDTWRKNTNAAC